LSPPALERIRNSPIREMVVTNTIPLSPEKQFPIIKVLSVAPLLGDVIESIHRGQSVGESIAKYEEACGIPPASEDED
jgi:ribose-phosphate pyrophosphokinase